MVQARDAVERRSWANPQEPTGEEWWADVLADPRARKRERRTDCREESVLSGLPTKSARSYLSRAASVIGGLRFCATTSSRRMVQTTPMPSLLNHLAAPGSNRLGSHWDRCGVHYVEPIEGAR